MATGNMESQWTPIGQWEQITFDVTGIIDTVVHYGFQTAKTNDERLAQSINLQYQIVNGISWKTGTDDYQPLVNTLAGVTKDSQDTYSADYSVDVPAACSYQVDAVVLSQWVISSADGSNKLYTPNLVCNYGSHENITRYCPPTGCLNEDCTVCSDPAS